MRLRASAVVAARGLNATLTVESGRTLALLGANGSGKSSLLGVLAGVLRPDSGDASLGDAELFNLSPGSATWPRPDERPIGLLGQVPMLFPHLSALDNVAFPARARGASKPDARRAALQWLRAVDAETLSASRPRELSGGESQRVAIARALAAEPEILLLDEPLAALDVDSAQTVRAVLASVLAERTAIFATHDVVDASMLADDIAVMHDGHIVEAGPTRDVLARPQHPFTARMAGRGLVAGVRTDSGIRLPDGALVACALADDSAVGSGVLLTVRPGSVRVVPASARLAKPAANTVTAPVTALETHAESLRIWAGGLIADMNLEEARTQAPRPGDVVTMHIDPVGAVVYARAVSLPSD
ncbi:sulfate/molybdate ABC transporter ATP-binding protein [Demequina aurantiaca]|uniref:sulfate/molybdate ABC transporter ATP-binding protein n=1 Tax=Demequina aurantiaca TaxID=676200 RepID=UPI0007844272|nr:ABC transporter ATP-binding protein [Demequina aurantiaca]